jgi:hypothetical protein
MSQPRFSIASLLALVLFLAIAFAALRAANELWDSAVFTGTLAILLAAVLLAVHRTQRRRAFWLGFAVFGWVALFASLVPAVESRLPTTKLLAYLDSEVLGRNARRVVTLSRNAIDLRTTVNSSGSPAWAQAATGRSVERLWNKKARAMLTGPNGTTENFIRIGHSLIALVLAWLGGHLSRSLYVGDRQAEGSEESRPAPALPG